MAQTDRLERLARELAETGAEGARSLFLAELRSVTDGKALKRIAESHTADVEVSVPAYERLLELEPENVAARAALGFVYFLDGEDEKAWAQIERGKAIHDDELDLLLLEAALTKERANKVKLYSRVLMLFPGNKVAEANLRDLGAV